MLRQLLESDEALGPTVRVTLERVSALLDGRSLYVEAGLDRRANEMKKRMADGLRAASDSELAELAGALGLEAKAVRRALG
jgi:hypothetical protein